MLCNFFIFFLHIILENSQVLSLLMKSPSLILMYLFEQLSLSRCYLLTSKINLLGSRKERNFTDAASILMMLISITSTNETKNSTKKRNGITESTPKRSNKTWNAERQSNMETWKVEEETLHRDCNLFLLLR